MSRAFPLLQPRACGDTAGRHRINSERELQGKVALVTGAGRGIGRTATLALAEAGADIDIDATSAAAAAEAIDLLGRRSLAVPADLGEIDAMVEHTVRALGGIDILVNNAALTQHARFLGVTEATCDRLHQVSAKGVFFCTSGSPGRRRRKGAAAGSSTSPRSPARATPRPRTRPMPRARAP
jgi:NAD(P)-dependent dehydrogenase (short-subunit alcohol dehydrogenase family)